MTANSEGVSASEVTVRWSTLLGAIVVPLAAAGMALWVSRAVSGQRRSALEIRVESIEGKAEAHRDRIDQR
ncbi:MAG: hypothetical protein IOD15_11250, partial [Phycisphaerales bacterium]|nr:hypothetical protein [Phycisphaerales bacterium]